MLKQEKLKFNILFESLQAIILGRNSKKRKQPTGANQFIMGQNINGLEINPIKTEVKIKQFLSRIKPTSTVEFLDKKSMLTNARNKRKNLPELIWTQIPSIKNESETLGIVGLLFEKREFLELNNIGVSFFKIFLKSFKESLRYYHKVMQTAKRKSSSATLKKTYIKSSKELVDLEDLRKLTKFDDTAKIYTTKEDKKPLLLLTINSYKPRNSTTVMTQSEETHKENLLYFLKFKVSRKSQKSKRTI